MIVFCKYNLYNDTKNPNGCTLLMFFPYAVVSAGNNLAEHDAVIVRNIFPFTGWYSGERHNGENSGLRCKDTVFYGSTYRWFRFFIWACRRGGAESRYIRTRHQMPPRRRAFRSNDFGLEPTTIPRDAKRQAEPLSRQGTHFHQNHFHCNPSRRLVGPHTRFAASNAQLRFNVL